MPLATNPDPETRQYLNRWEGRPRADCGRWLSPAVPADFEPTFLRIGRQACEAHYRVARDTVTRWLDECGKERLIAQRSEAVTKRSEKAGLTPREMSVVLKRAFPQVSFTLARHAAQHLRIVRNGGYRVSPASGGDWRVELKIISAFELVELAKAKGFNPASLTGVGE